MVDFSMNVLLVFFELNLGLAQRIPYVTVALLRQMASTEMVIRDRAKEITLPASGICAGAGPIDSAMVP